MIHLNQSMTPDDAMRLAQFQRPGVKLIVGPTEAREEMMQPINWLDYAKLPGDASWERVAHG